VTVRRVGVRRVGVTGLSSGAGGVVRGDGLVSSVVVMVHRRVLRAVRQRGH
jgi:hypothetical protein